MGQLLSCFYNYSWFIYLSCEVTRKSVKAFSFLDMIAYTCTTMQKYWGIHYNLQFRCFYGKKICDISLIKWKTTLDIKEIYKVGKKKLLVFLCVHVQNVFSDRNQCLCNKYSLYKDLVEGQSPQYHFNSVPPLSFSKDLPSSALLGYITGTLLQVSGRSFVKCLFYIKSDSWWNGNSSLNVYLVLKDHSL